MLRYMYIVRLVLNKILLVICHTYFVPTSHPLYNLVLNVCKYSRYRM